MNRYLNEIQGFVFSIHANAMVLERKIKTEWIKVTLEESEKCEIDENGCIHYIKTIPEFGLHRLRVVVNPNVQPSKIVTLFFDRRLKEKK